MDTYLLAMLALTFAIIAVALYILISKKNLIRILMGLEILVLAAQTLFIVLSAVSLGSGLDPMVQSALIIFTPLAAAVATTFMVLIYLSYKRFGTLDVTKLSTLRW